MPSETTKTIMEDLAKRGKKGLDLAKQIMQKEKMDYPELRKALGHYLVTWNDFTHTGLFSLACEAVDGDIDWSLPIQASIALMAAAFDIHDDIIDRSETKHDTPTVYGKYGEEIALLLGNALLMEGFALIFDSTVELSPIKKRETLRVLKTNLFEVGNAHALELGLKGNTTASTAEYIQFVEKKAASIEADMSIGAIIGGGTEDEIKALAKYGRSLGILTTLREEFIDVFEIEELAQKVRINRLPIPIIFAMKSSQDKKEIRKILEKKHIVKSDVDKIVEIVFKSSYVKKLKKGMESHVFDATSMLPRLRNKAVSSHLSKLVSSMLEDL